MTRLQLALCIGICVTGALCAGEVGAKPERDTRDALRDAFAESIQRVEAATVVCVPTSPKYKPFPCSGVILSKSGVVLTSDMAGVSIGDLAKSQFDRKDRVQVRVPRKDGRGYVEYPGQLVCRFNNLGAGIVVLEKVGLSTLTALRWGDSDKVEIGGFALTAGITLGHGDDALPAVNLGVVSAVHCAERAGERRRRYLFTDATMFAGMHGGPVTDVDGNLIGILAWKAADELELLYGGLSAVIPASRLRAEFDRERVRSRPARAKATAAMRGSVRSKAGSTPAHAVQAAIHEAASIAHPSVVSLTVTRTGKVLDGELVGGKAVPIPRYRDALSGVVISDAGHVVTSLYNLSTPAFAFGATRSRAAKDKLDEELGGIRSFRIHSPSGCSWRGRLVGHDIRLGVAVIAADLEVIDARPFPKPLSLVPVEERVPGRFVVTVGYPYESGTSDDLVCTWGILSRFHEGNSSVPWSGQWQTDAGVVDSNCGGAAVDLEGRLLGMTTLWSPARHGRNAGVGFIVDADALSEVVERFR